MSLGIAISIPIDIYFAIVNANGLGALYIDLFQFMIDVESSLVACLCSLLLGVEIPCGTDFG
jgi:hypothetical protein